jgi:hypothetical protein
VAKLPFTVGVWIRLISASMLTKSLETSPNLVLDLGTKWFEVLAGILAEVDTTIAVKKSEYLIEGDGTKERWQVNIPSSKCAAQPHRLSIVGSAVGSSQKVEAADVVTEVNVSK